MSTNDAAERVRVLLVDAYWRNVDVGAAKAGALLDAALAEAEARGRAKGLEEGADALEKEAAFLESRIGYAREASTMRDAESLLRVLAQPEPTPDDDVSPI